MSNAFQLPGLCRRPVPRRRLMGSAFTASASLAMVTIAGCGSKGRSNGGQASNQSGPKAAPKRGGTLTLGGDFLRGFDPHVLQATDTGLFGMFYSTLIRTNAKTFELEPDLAAKWESPSETEIVFSLSPDIKWHQKPPMNGRALKADDIIFSYNRARSADPKFINKSYLADIDTMQAVDAQTLRLTLKQPVVTQLINLATASLKILAPEVIEKSDKLATDDTAIGTGAFILQQSQPHVGSTLLRNPDYFKPGLPYVDRVQLKAFQDAESEWSAFLARQIDHRWVPGQDSAKFASEKANQYTFDWVGDLGFDLTMANVQRKPFDDARVTRALRLLIDHDEFKSGWSDVWFGRGRNTVCFDAATADNWDLPENEYRTFLEWQKPKDSANKEAISLLSAAGFTKDKPLKFTLAGTAGQTNPYAQAAVQLLQAQFQKNSQRAVDPTIKLYDTATWTAVRAHGDFEYFTAGQNPGGEDPDATFSSAYQTGGSRNYGKMSDAQLDQMFARQRTIFDEQQRKKAVQDILRYMVDHIPYGALVARYVLNATQSKVEGFPAEGTSFKSGEHYESLWIH